MNFQTYCFRLNSNIVTGIGHIMRCVRVAKNLKERGHKCIFYLDKESKFNYLMREFEIKYIYQRNINFQNQKEDAKFFLEKLDINKKLKIIVDDYRLDYEWEKIVSNNNRIIIVFDDEEKNKHDCNVYINYKPDLIEIENFNYNLIKNKSTKLLLGSKYCVLDTITKPKKKLKSKKYYNICFYMGGAGDFKYFDKIIIKLIEKININENSLFIYIIAGPGCKNIKPLVHLSKKFNFIKIVDGKQNLKKTISIMDLIIGSAGNIVYEASFYNIPSLFFEISNNQNNKIYNMEKIGHYFMLPASELKEYLKLSSLIYLMLKNYKRIYKLNLEKKTKIDDKGVHRIVKNLISSNVDNKKFKQQKKKENKQEKKQEDFKIKRIKDNEVNKYLYSRNLSNNRNVSFVAKKINRLDHYIWWLSSKRNTFAISIKQKKIMYLYDETFRVDSKNYSLQGWFATENKIGIKEVLLGLNWHRKYFAKKKNIELSFSIIKKNNAINFSKYLGWKLIDNSSKEFEVLKKINQINNNYNYYIRY